MFALDKFSSVFQLANLTTESFQNFRGPRITDMAEYRPNPADEV